jgi:hypothetical protein
MDNSSLWNPNLAYRRLYEGIMGNYLKKINEKWYYTDIKEIAKENKIANWIVKTIRSSTHQTKDRYKGMYKVLILYVGIVSYYGYLLYSLISSQKNLT